MTKTFIVGAEETAVLPVDKLAERRIEAKFLECSCEIGICEAVEESCRLVVANVSGLGVSMKPPEPLPELPTKALDV